jgi:UDP-GlcNAc:undecaprenyl-phosphate/decaprenyl-phosphate GlcNAc-1-phosphate transferase
MHGLILLLAAADEPKVMGGFRWPMLAGMIALVVSWALTPYVRKFAIAKGAMDDPKSDERRVHKEPTPRWGGLAIFAGIVLSLGVVLPFAFPNSSPFPPYLIGMFVIGALVVIMGALDDLFQFPAKIQAVFLILAGVAVQFFYDNVGRIQIGSFVIPFMSHEPTATGARPDVVHLGIWAFVLTAIYIFVVAKTMDTIDGVDGLAAGIAAIAAATFTVIAVYGSQPRTAIIAAAIAGASVGFLRHNYNPAKIFMGTGGAQLLGFLLACLSVVGALKTAAAVAIIIPIFVFGVPILDAVIVVIRRLLSGQPITQADKRHMHHQLLNKGLSQRQTVWVLYTAALVLCVLIVVVVRIYGNS